jgi:glycerol-3-phosphate cytidylyltransferase
MIVGFIAGAFDVIHPGYIRMFEEAKQNCDYLVVGLHRDPETNGKFKPILSAEDRFAILNSIWYIDIITLYSGEDELLSILKNSKIDIRFLGEDYRDKSYTGKELNIPVHYLDRSHGWSTTKFKTLIYEQIHGKDL